MAEIQALLGPTYQVLTPRDIGLKDFAPVEDGSSFAENAQIKSQALFQATGLPSLADDSGLAVDALGGEPGVHSARFGGNDSFTDRDRANLVLEKLLDTSPRTARFVCVLAYTTNAGTDFFEGKVEGEITRDWVSGGGFGYDPIFYYPPLGKTFSQLTGEEKNLVSHRGKALQKFMEFLSNSSNNQKAE